MHGADEPGAGDRRPEGLDPWRGTVCRALSGCQAEVGSNTASTSTGLRHFCTIVGRLRSGADGRRRRRATHRSMGAGSRAAPDPRRRGGHARRPRAAHRSGALDRRPARGRAARPRARLRGRRQRVDRRAPADRPGLQPHAPASCSSPTSAPRTRGWRSATSAATPLAEVAFDIDIAAGPEAVLGVGPRALRRAARARRAHGGGRARDRHRRARAGGVRARAQPVNPPIMPGLGRRSRSPSWFAERYDAPVLVDNDVNIMALGEHWTHWRDTRAPAVREGRHRHRLRDRRRPGGSTAAPRARRATSATSALAGPRRRRLPLRQRRLPGGRRGRAARSRAG